MKLSSISHLNNINPAQPLRAEFVANAEGRALMLVNGRPVQLEGELASNARLAAQIAQKAGIVSSSADSEVVVSATKVLSQAGLENNQTHESLVNVLREYGIQLSSENLHKAVAAASSLPGFSTDKLNLSTIVLVLLKDLPVGNSELVREYISGNFEFAKLFAKMPPELAAALKKGWESGQLLPKLQQILSDKGSLQFFTAENESIEEFAAALRLQEMLSEQAAAQKENRVYFQWPLFWSDQNQPDTLEGEAFFDDTPEDKQGFCLRVLVRPPNLGPVEVALNSIEHKLWVHFGTQPEFLDDVRAFFPVLQGILLAQGFAEVRLTAARIRDLENFFVSRPKHETLAPGNEKIDVRA
jgi:hypothetical protein